MELTNSNIKNRNKNLIVIQRLLKRNDEFYTLYSDIDKELQYYKKHFKNKVVYCNCDHPKHSQFFMYFALHFWDLRLKKLICSFYADNNKDVFASDFTTQHGGYCIYDGYHNGQKLQTKEEIQYFINNDIRIIHFKGSGDFRSQECKKLLMQSDIVATNPPFSLFREFVLQLIKYNKKFVVIGSLLAIAYIKIFKLYKQKKIFIGINSISKFNTSNNTLANIVSRWFTNLDIPKTYPKPLDTGCYYYENPSKYPTYNSYPAINVNKICEIPMDYERLMGVPISFIYTKYNPCQFEIIGISKEIPIHRKRFLVQGKQIFTRIIIKHKNPSLNKHSQPLQLENSLHSQYSLHSQPLQLENSLFESFS